MSAGSRSGKSRSICSDSSRRSSNRISHCVSAMRLRVLVHSAGSRPNSAGTRTSTHAGTGSVTMPAWAERAPGSQTRATSPVARCDERARPAGGAQAASSPFDCEVRVWRGASVCGHLRRLPLLASGGLVQRCGRHLHLQRVPGQRQEPLRDPRPHLARDRRNERVHRRHREVAGFLTERLPVEFRVDVLLEGEGAPARRTRQGPGPGR
jgi:hypothetical protein